MQANWVLVKSRLFLREIEININAIKHKREIQNPWYMRFRKSYKGQLSQSKFICQVQVGL